MNRIEKLIEELCPEGVEHRPLGELGEFIRGNGLQKKDLVDSGVGAIHYGQLYTHYGVWADQTLSFVTQSKAEKLRTAFSGDLVIATTSENAEDVCKAVAWVGSDPIVVSGDAYIFRHCLDPKFVAFFFQSTSFQIQKRSSITGTKVKRISGKSLATIQIPLPPKDIQQRIALILDHFVELEAKLEAELEAELEARSIQAQFYREQLFSSLGNDNTDTVKWIPLSEIGDWYGGGTPSKANKSHWESGNIPWISPKDMGKPIVTSTQDYISEVAIAESSTKLVPANSVAVVVRSSILDRIWPTALVPISFTLNQDMKAVHCADSVLAAYVAHYFNAHGRSILQKTRRSGGSVTSIVSSELFAYKVPVPPLSEQARIVAILDKFDALVNDLTSGLPAEIEARRKQYEYYRDRLLTFKRAS